MVRESESSASLYEITRRTQEEFGLPIVAIIDEEHLFWSKTADKSAAVLDRINPAVEIRISATPKTLHPDETVKVYRQDVIAAEMIKKEVVLNPDIELDFSEERTLNQNLIKAALGKRDQLAEAYRELGVDINPLPESDDAVINENRRRVKDTIRLGVKNVNVEIPKDVHFQNEEQTLQVEQVKFARKASEIDRVFLAYISTKGHQFESKGRTDKIAGYLLEMLADYFGIFETDAKKVVLYHDNKPKFDRLIDKALETYARKRQTDKARSAARREFKQYDWEVPEERVYDSEMNHIEEAPNHALQPFVQLNQASCPEKEFVKFLEANHEWIDWWYKNGDKGKQHYAIAYGEGKARSLFYVDFIIRMKNGHVYLFDTKSAGSDALAHEKHNALLKYIQKNSTEGTPLFGGIILQQGSNWLYSKLPIENTTDTLNWDCFYPEKA